MRKLFLSKSVKLISPHAKWQKCGFWIFFLGNNGKEGSVTSGYNQCYLQCWDVTVLQHYNNVCITYTHIMQGNSWAPRTSAHGVKRNPTERMKWMHWDKIFNRLYIAGTFRFNLMAFIFGSYLRSSRSVYGSVTHNSLTFDHEPEYLLCAGCGKFDWVL